MVEAATHHRTCHLCEAMCGLTIKTEGDRVVRIEGDSEDPFSRGYICPKGGSLRELHEDPDVVRTPLVRRDGKLVAASWDEALDAAAVGLARVQNEYGRHAVATYYGNPTAHNYGAVLGTQALGLALGTRNHYDANSQDANPRLWASYFLYGDLVAVPVPDIDRTNLFVIIGGNPIASNGSLMSLGDVRGRFKALRERGGKLVVVDPRKTETASIADQHVPIRPGADAHLLLGLLQVMFAEDLVQRLKVGMLASGLDALAKAVERFTPERIERFTGIAASVVRQLARDLATTEKAVVYGRIGVCLNEYGVLASYLIDVVNVVTGHWDREGGAMFAKPAVDLASLARRLGVAGVGSRRTRVRGLPDTGGQLPASALAEEMETPGQDQVRALVSVAGNPVLSVPNGERIARALERLDFYVAIDPYINETTRHADVVLPPCSPLSRDHFDLLLSAFAVRNTVKYSLPVFPNRGPDDFAILVDLSLRLAAARTFGPAARTWGRSLARALPKPASVLDALLRIGPYRRSGLSLAKLRDASHGIDLGPLVPMRKERVRTPDGRVVLAAPQILEEIVRAGRDLDRPGELGLVLIGRRHLRSNNSWMHNLPSLTKGPDRSQLLVNPKDAAARGLATGDMATIRTRVGSISAVVQITADVMEGVVSLPHGYGHAAASDTMRVAGALAGANMNAITDDARLERLSGTAVLNGTPVEVFATPTA